MAGEATALECCVPNGGAAAAEAEQPTASATAAEALRIVLVRDGAAAGLGRVTLLVGAVARAYERA